MPGAPWRDRRRPWSYYTQFRIDPLPPQSADELLRALVGDDPGLGPLKQLLIERTEGPLSIRGGFTMAEPPWSSSSKNSKGIIR